MTIEILLYFVVLSYLSVFLCRDSNCQGFVHSLAQTLQQAIYRENQVTFHAAQFFMHVYVWYYICRGFCIELVRDQQFSDVQVHFLRQLIQRTAPVLNTVLVK